MALPLYPGCDVWLNNPLRPYEACGTSGMKAALNGGLNLSILDGWWDEWYDGSNGWAIPSADGIDDPDRRDDLEAAALYDLIEHEVAPRFYDVDDDGVPTRWLEMVRHTITSLGPEGAGHPAGARLRAPALRARGPAGAGCWTVAYDGARDLASWKQRVREQWPSVHVEHVESVDPGDSAEVGSELSLHAYVALGGLSPDDVEVQVVHGRTGHEDELTDFAVVPMMPGGVLRGRRGTASTRRLPLDQAGPFGYTVRVVPRHRALASVAELGLVALPG